MLLVALALLCTAAFGQGTATILGTVSDPSGAVVPNAKITMTNVDNGFVRSTTSNNTGNYSARELPIGRYQVRVEAQGFKTYEQKDITLNVNDTLRIDAALQIGTVGQSVTVEANALQVQADTNDVSQTITSNQISNLATNGRNILQLTALVPGAASNMPDFDLPGAQWQNRQIQFNGMRQDANNWLIDGGEAYDRGGGGILLVSPSQDAIQEFKIETSNYAADLGNSSGGMTTMALKSGTKQFHASAWEYNRNDALDAWEYFAKQSSAKKAELRYNAYGFNAGGPVEFKSSNPKTFFFYNMEWRKLIQGGSIHNLAPTSDEYGGDMSGFAPSGDTTAVIWVPNTTDPNAIAKFSNAGLAPGQPFQYQGKLNVIPPSLLDQNAVNYIKAGYFLTPNTSNGYYYSAANTITPYREEIVRIDHNFNDKIAVMGHMIYDSTTQQAPIVSWTGNTFPTVGSLETVPSWQGVVHVTYNIRPNLLNEVAWNFNGNDITIANTGLWKAPSDYTPDPLFPSANTISKITGIEISGGPIGVSMDSGNWPWQNWWRSNQWKDDLSYMHGSHNLKFGFLYFYTTKKQQIFENTAGTFNFNGNATGCSVAAEQTLYGSEQTYCPANTGGIGLADFLLGDANYYNQGELQDFVDIANVVVDGYAMDDWHASRRLTLNLGVRWEALPHAYDLNNRLGNFYPSLWNPADAGTFTTPTSGALNTSGPGFTLVSGVKLSSVPFFQDGIGLAGRNGIPRGLVTNHWANFGPRLGFAYDMGGNQRSILRGGFGTFYERNAGNEEYNMGTDPPFSNSAQTNYAYLDTPTVSYQTGENAGASPTTPQGFTGVQKSLPITTVYQFSLGIQQQVRSNMVATLGFVGNTAVHLSQTIDVNTLPASDTADRTGVCGGPCGYSGNQLDPDYHRQYVGWSGINLVYDEGNAHYEGWQATLRANAWRNLTLGAAYTLGHEWDVIDGQLFNNVDNPLNPRYTYGTSGFDRRQVGVVNFEYNVPGFQHSNGFARTVLGGWAFSGIASFESGNPLTVDGPNWLGFGSGTTQHADFTGSVSYPHTVAQWFNPTAFSAAPPLQWGTAPKSVLKGPGEDHWNLSLYKDFKFNERSGLQFRADSFNVWNHATFNSVATGVLTGNASNPYTSNAGALTNTGDPREFQFGAKIYF